MAQWPFLESVSQRFRSIVLASWFDLKQIRLSRDLSIAREDLDEGKYGTEILNSLLEKLSLRAPNIIDLGGFRIASQDVSGTFLNNVTFRQLSKFGNLRTIVISGSKMRSYKLADFLETSSSRGELKELTIDATIRCPPRDDSIVGGVASEWLRLDGLLATAFSNGNSNLAPLKLEKLSVAFHDFDMYGFTRVIDVSRLTTLNIGSPSCKVTPVALLSLITRATNLTNLEFGVLGDFSLQVDVQVAQNVEIFRTVAGLEHLTSLTINNRMCEERGWEILETELVSMIEAIGGRRRLEEFTLRDRCFLTQSIFSAIADNLPQLKLLDLSLFRYFPSEPLMPLVTKLRHLEKLILVDDTLLRMGKTANVNDAVLSAIATNLTELRCLSLSVLAATTDGLKTLKMLGNLKNLKNLTVGGERPIGKPTMKVWSNGFGSKLESLVLYCPFDVDDDGLIAFVRNSFRLRELRLPVANITDSSLRAIALSCRDLRYLSISGRDQEMITIDSIQAVVDGCSQLRYMQIKSGNRRFDRRDVNIEKYRKLTF